VFLSNIASLFTYPPSSIPIHSGKNVDLNAIFTVKDLSCTSATAIIVPTILECGK
jgi:hypothetical protein